MLTRYPTEPDNYDWNSTRAISLSDSDVPSEGKIERSSASTPELDDEKKDEPTATVATAVLDAQDPGVVAPALEEAATDPALDRAVLQKVFVRSLWISGIFALVIAIIIPIPMFASHYVFSRRFFEVWVACVSFPLDLLVRTMLMRLTSTASRSSGYCSPAVSACASRSPRLEPVQRTDSSTLQHPPDPRVPQGDLHPRQVGAAGDDGQDGEGGCRCVRVQREKRLSRVCRFLSVLHLVMACRGLSSSVIQRCSDV